MIMILMLFMMQDGSKLGKHSYFSAKCRNSPYPLQFAYQYIMVLLAGAI